MADRIIFTIKLADRIIKINCIYKSTMEFCKEYLLEDGADNNQEDFVVVINDGDIIYEREKSAAEDKKEGIPIRFFSDEYLETLAVYRKIVDKMIDYDTLLFHGSVIAVDGEGYLFTAKSGTGKSTHTKLWREHFKERAVMINDDKPLIKIEYNNITVYGTPWNGKHGLSTNISCTLKAISILNRSSDNHIERVDGRSEYPLLLQQTYRSKNTMNMTKTLNLLDNMIDNVKVYSLFCNMDPEAAVVAYEGMQG